MAKKQDKKQEAVRKTNRQFAAENKFFRQCCEVMGLKPNARQASKFRRETGLAYSQGRDRLRDAEAAA